MSLSVFTGPVQERSGDFIIGRVAVLPEFRGRNLGAQIMLALEQEARRVGGKRISLSAQCRASGFYQTLGYREIGEAYLEDVYKRQRYGRRNNVVVMDVF